MQLEWVNTGIIVLMALGLVEIRCALFGILRREEKIMATEQEIEDVFAAIGNDVDKIKTEFSDFANQIASLQGQLAQAGHPTDVSSALMDKATAIRDKLDALAASVAVPPASDTLTGGNASDTLTGDNGDPPKQ